MEVEASMKASAHGRSRPPWKPRPWGGRGLDGAWRGSMDASTLRRLRVPWRPRPPRAWRSRPPFSAFIGVSIIIYSTYMLNQWHHHESRPPPAPSPSSSEIKLTGDTISALNFVRGVVFGVGDNGLRLDSNHLPAPWFIYAFMGVGILICLITCIGHIAAEAINGCCLCFYALLTAIFVLLEAGLVAFIAIDRRWEKDVPFDATGELDSMREFIQENADVFMWVGISIVIIQVLSLLLATILRSLVPSQRVDHDIEGDYDARSRTREPLINPHPNQASGSTRVKGDDKMMHNDIWSSRMREKYGLNGGDGKYNSLHQNSSADSMSKQ